MFIKKLQAFNYKSYDDSGLMEFTPGINIIVGQNNAGKTSLLELLTLKFENQPHLSLKKLRTKSSRIKEESRGEFYLSFRIEELRSFIQQSPSPVGIHPPPDDFNEVEVFHLPVYENLKRLRKLLDSSEPIDIRLSISPALNLDTSSRNNLLTFKKLISDYSLIEGDNHKFYQIKYDSDENLIFDINHSISVENEYDEIHTYNADIHGSIGFKIFNKFVKNIYRFNAERLNIGICTFGNNSELKPDASNLAEVLAVLQGSNPARFNKLNQYVSDILPQIKRVSVRHQDNSNLEIMVWNIEYETEENDLSFPLSSCGSGVSQVLAIVYILVSSEEPRTLIIDEPQSFLHPGAARKLIEIIKQFPQHQYFIATHSPEIITAANPSNIIKLQYENCETKASVIDATKIESQNAILDELGVRLSDVFGADNILWVEGETEEKCFPLILEKVLNKQLRGTKILAVQQTGDFDGTKASIIFDIYNQLSGGSNLFAPAIGFFFDSENKSEEDKKSWQERSQKPVEFLSRRMYENYLLDPDAIAAVFNEDEKHQSQSEPIHITSVQVEEWLEKKKQEKEFSEEDFLYKVHGSQILEQLFSNFSQRKIKFKKTKHSYELTKWLLEHKRCFLSELAAEVENML